ncbi:trans-sulfuration enzyme family protein [Acuticoccus sp.]|uniref:trans-sulfuration enzyme family protein n=1 Tax=Acuticoccus sp. TaxID=1904378 RepID=UPI003B51845F
MRRRPWQRATIAAQADGQVDEASGGVVGPWQPSTTFLRDADYAPPASGDVYRRDQNPTVREAERVIAALEGAAEARLFASGLAAIAAVMRSAGGPVVVQRGTYYGTAVLAERLAAAGLPVATFDPADMGSLEAACAEHRPALVLIETPSNPWLTVVPIAEAASIAHRHGARLAVDSTAATPIVTRPLEHGADVVVHSATKALNGHSDVLAGAVAVAEPSGDAWDELLKLRATEGAVASPFDAWLLTRGMRTVHLRVAEAGRSALHIAHWLAEHPRVATVRYPGLADHPRHAVAAAQMDGFGMLLSFDVKDGAPHALAVAGRLNLVKRATSLGGVESLIEHRHSIEPAATGIPEGLLRLSVGIEAVEDLVADLAEALDAP